MEIEELLEISSEIRDSIRKYISENIDYGEIIVRRERDVRTKPFQGDLNLERLS